MSFPLTNCMRLVVLALCVFALHMSVGAQQHVNLERGLNAHSYLSGDFDHVNLYNGNLTLTIPIGQSYKVGGGLEYGLTLVYNTNSVWYFKREEQPNEGEQTRAEVNPKSNSGLGWTVSLGALYPPNKEGYNEDLNFQLYVAPDGSEHLFGGDGITTDGTFLRLRTEGGLRKVDFPNGQVHTFGANNQLSKIEDRFGNVVDVDRTNPAVWLISEKCDSCAMYTRQQKIFFGVGGQVESVLLTAFTRPGEAAKVAEYKFHYSQNSIRRHVKDTWVRPNNSDHYVNVWMLTGLELPAGAGWYDFTYNTDFIETSGYVTSATLPTRGHYKWAYQQYTMPVAVHDPTPVCMPYCPDELSPLSSTYGVLYKQIYSRPNGPFLGSFEYKLGGELATKPDPRGWVSNTVKTPEGDETVNYFNNSYDDLGNNTWDFGLPYNPKQSANSPQGDLYLSQEIYQGEATGGKQPLRRVYVKYGGDPRPNFPGQTNNNRVTAERTTYEDGLFADVYYKDWNGLGQFKTVETGGSFLHGNTRTTVTDYSSAIPGVGAPWLLNLYTSRTTTEESSTSKVSFCFNANTGFLEAKRIHKGSGTVPQDIYIDYVADGNGNVVSEKSYGGDKTGNAGSNPDACVSPSGVPEYEKSHTNSFGILATSKILGQDFFTTNNTIDQRTGLISSSTDTAGVVTTFDYDELGRVKKIDSFADEDTYYTYTTAAGSNLAKVTIERKSSETDTTPLAVGYLTFDNFGRTTKSGELVPTGPTTSVLSEKETKYNAMGWVTSSSEFGDITKTTQFVNYDPFGRAGKIISPDNFDTIVDYTGVSIVKRTVKIGTNRDAAGNILKSPASTYEFYDRQGRLQSVQEESGLNGAPKLTKYRYDVGNRIKEVAINYEGSPEERTNVALLGQATASSTANSNFPASSAINGDRKGVGWAQGTGGWTDGTQSNYSTDIVQVNFPGFKSISEIDVYTLRDNYARTDAPTLTETFSTADNTGQGMTHFEVQYWSGGVWVTIPGGVVVNNDKVWRQFKFPEVVTSAVRVQVYGSVKWANGNNYSRIVEIEAWGRPANDTIWVDDSVPAGATLHADQETWNWVSANPGPTSGGVSHQSAVYADWHQHYFYNATQTLSVNPGERLIADVFIDPWNLPREVMLQWNDGIWEHRAYWGEDLLPWGTNGTNSKRYMGPLPTAGQWIRLEVPASDVGLEGRVINGMAFSMFGGRASWDRAGKTAAMPQTIWSDDSMPAGSNTAGTTWAWVSNHVSGNFAHQTHPAEVGAGWRQHLFQGATQTLTINSGDRLFAYVYLDPTNPPNEVMMQWLEPGSWEHRAYWKATEGSTIPWGVEGTNSRRYMGKLPPLGQWVRLEVPASLVGLEGKTINGMAFTHESGQITWDYAGKAAGVPIVNHALQSAGAATWASSQASANFPVSAVNDGDRLGNNWSVGGYGSGWNDGTPNEFASDWLQVTFAGNKTIDEIDVFTLQTDLANPQEPTLEMTFNTADNTGYGITDFEVQYLNPTTGKWVNIPHAEAHVTGNNKIWRQFKFPAINTGAIRVAVHGSVRFTKVGNNYSRIVEVEAYQVATPPQGGATQTRTFSYDNRGFLFTETHPEISGAVTYSKYDTMGQVGKKVEGGKSLLYNYDPTGRLLDIKEESTNRLLKEFAYYDTNGTGGNYRLGKLKKATRHNWVKNPFSSDPNAPELDVKISEEYTYAGREGRLDTRVTRMNEENPTHYKFNQTFQYDELGALSTESYPECQNATCVQSGVATPRTVKSDHTNGYLTKVWSPSTSVNYASNISYHLNRTENTVQHGNGVTDTYARDATNNMPRPHNISFTKGTTPLWSTGQYEYDGLGNVVKMGSDWFIYDRVNRVKEGTAGFAYNGIQRKQAYTYDVMGNVLTITTTDHEGTKPVYTNPVVPQTNRLLFYYDDAGNFLGVSAPNLYQYDPLNMMKKLPGKTYLYGPKDERMWVVDKQYNDLGPAPNPAPTIVQTVTLRGLNNEMLREYTIYGGDAVNSWAWTKDYVYRNGKLLSSETPSGRFDYHVDHLGTPRIVTASNGNQTAGYAQYLYPYGAEAQPFFDQRLKFTGHERDNNIVPGHRLDYMHARYYAFDNSRFINVDSGRDFDPKQPQSWNRYSYVRGNPINATDPTGKWFTLIQIGQAIYQRTSADNGGTDSGGLFANLDRSLRQLLTPRAAPVAQSPPELTANPIIQSYMINLWNKTKGGLMEFEESMWISLDKGHPQPLTYVPWPQAMLNQEAEWPHNVVPLWSVAVIHTHTPKGMKTTSPKDHRLANRIRVPVYALTKVGVFKALPDNPTPVKVMGPGWWKNMPPPCCP